MITRKYLLYINNEKLVYKNIKIEIQYKKTLLIISEVVIIWKLHIGGQYRELPSRFGNRLKLYKNKTRPEIYISAEFFNLEVPHSKTN